MNNCIYHASWSWITNGPKSNCDNIRTKAILFFFGCSEVNSTWLITSELANQRGRKVLFTCVVYTTQDYFTAAEKSQFSWTRLAKDCQIFGVWETNRDQVNSLRNGEDSDIEQIEKDFKDPEDGFWDKNDSEGIVSNFEVPVNLDIYSRRVLRLN